MVTPNYTTAHLVDLSLSTLLLAEYVMDAVVEGGGMSKSEARQALARFGWSPEEMDTYERGEAWRTLKL